MTDINTNPELERFAEVSDTLGEKLNQLCRLQEEINALIGERLLLLHQLRTGGVPIEPNLLYPVDTATTLIS